MAGVQGPWDLLHLGTTCVQSPWDFTFFTPRHICVITSRHICSHSSCAAMASSYSSSHALVAHSPPRLEHHEVQTVSVRVFQHVSTPGKVNTNGSTRCGMTFHRTFTYLAREATRVNDHLTHSAKMREECRLFWKQIGKERRGLKRRNAAMSKH